MKNNQSFLESAEFDEFFRQGDEPAPACDSIQPVVGNALVAEESPPDFAIRTPAQRARRARFVRIVSVTMAVLSSASMVAFAVKLWPASGHSRPSVVAANLGAPSPQAPPNMLPELEAEASAESGRETTTILPGLAPGALNLDLSKARQEPSASLPTIVSGNPREDVSAVSNDPSVDATVTAASTKAANKREATPMHRRWAQVSSSVHAARPPVVLSKAPKPKPEGYHPPTARFSD
ncbi:MAG TPA: hypothetical protein VIV60_11475 [Polyangiaceae bacterium]